MDHEDKVLVVERRDEEVLGTSNRIVGDKMFEHVESNQNEQYCQTE